MPNLSEMRRRHTKTHLYVLRVELNDGNGPFVHALFSLPGSKKHPMPRHDGLEQWIQGRRFGCRNPRQLQRWFGQFWPRLRNAHVCLYKVPREKVCVGKTQVLFDREAAELVKKAAVSELF